MKPKFHFILGIIFTTIIYFIFHLSFLQLGIIFVSSFFIIDLDHYLIHLFKLKTISLIDFLKYPFRLSTQWKMLPKKSKYKYPIFLFHSIEFLIILLILALFFKIVYLIIAGFAFHLLMDYLDLIFRKGPLYSKISIIYLLQKNKNKENFIFK